MPGIWGDDLAFGSIPPERSLWLQEALAGETDQPRLEGELEADFCVVGGGYTGLWAALRLKELEPSAVVALLEADICGGGPSGRNGGFMDPWWAKFFPLAALCGNDEALRLCRMSSVAIDEIETFCEEHGIDAHIRRDGGVWVAANEAGNGSWRPLMEGLERRGVDIFREVEGAELRAMTGTDAYIAGAFDAEQATVQPALLARGMRRVAVDAGVLVFENSAVTRLRRGGRPVVETAAGRVASDRLLLAMGPWLGQVHELRNGFATIATDMVATEPAPDRLEQIGLTSGIGISDSRAMINYYRTTLDGRIAWGKGGGGVGFGGRVGRRLHGASTRPGMIVDSLRGHYPSLADLRITHSWTGPVDRTVTGLPFFSRLGGERNVFYGGGYSGNGVVPSLIGGRILASLALGLEDEYSSAGLVRDPAGSFPPEPARWIGGQVVRRAIERIEGIEDRGESPGRVLRAVASLAPPSTSDPGTGS